MSHELTEIDSMVSAEGRKPWHFNLGTPVNLVDGTITVSEGPKLAGLDWMVEHRPIFVPRTVGMNPDGTEAVEYDELEDHRAVVRVDADRPLGVVGSQHSLVQNEALFDLAAAIQAESEDEVLVETAGSLKGNRLVWVLARLNRDLNVDGDEHVPYLLLANSHDGTMALRVQTTPVRVVCWNTLSWAIGGQQAAWVARHTSGVGVKVDAIHQALGMTFSYLDKWEAEVRQMMDTAVKPAAFDKFVERLVPVEPNATDRMVRTVEGRRAEVRQLHEGPTVAPFTGTAWGAINAATEWQQWVRPVQGDRDDRQGTNALNGETALDTTRIKGLLAKSVPELAGAGA